MKLGSKPAPRPGGPQNDLLAALQEAEEQHQKQLKEDRKRKKKKPGRFAGLPGALKIGATVALVVLVALVADGLRREAAELRATLVAVTGSVTLQKGGEGPQAPVRTGAELTARDVLTSGRDGTATIAFPDGSAITLEPNSQFEIRMLDFTRGTQRDRTFLVRFGSVVSRVSRSFGAQSQSTVATPTAVAAARGTGYRVTYDSQNRQTYVAVVDGTVNVRTGLGGAPAQAGQVMTLDGYRYGGAQGLPPAAQTRIGSDFQRLGRYDRGQGFLQTIEYALNTALDPFLQIVGLAPGSWSYAASSAARRATCQEGLRRLQRYLLDRTDEQIPEVVSLTTLDELSVDSREKWRILDTFQGGMIDTYRRTGPGAWEITVTARDRQRTRYRMTEIGIQQIR